MRRFRRIAIVAVAIIVFNLMGGVAYANESFEQQLLKEVNARRAEAGLTAISYGTYEKAADERASEASLVWSHYRPDGSYFDTVDSRIWGETLYRGPKDVKEVVDAWMASPTHEDLLMDKYFKTATIGVYGNEMDCYIAMEFGY